MKKLWYQSLLYCLLSFLVVSAAHAAVFCGHVSKKCRGCAYNNVFSFLMFKDGGEYNPTGKLNYLVGKVRTQCRSTCSKREAAALNVCVKKDPKGARRAYMGYRHAQAAASIRKLVHRCGKGPGVSSNCLKSAARCKPDKAYTQYIEQHYSSPNTSTMRRLILSNLKSCRPRSCSTADLEKIARFDACITSPN